MNDDLLVALQHCLDILGQNDLENNKLMNLLQEIKNINNSSFALTNKLRQEMTILKEISQDYHQNDQLRSVIAVTKDLALELEHQNENFYSITKDVLKITNSILNKNHETFMAISKQISNNKQP